MADEHFPSMDACVDAASEPTHKVANIARRSLSVFSRRGTETPEPRPTFIAQAAMMPSKPAPRQMTEKQKSWIGRRNSVCTRPKSPKASHSKTPKGTILHAVPPAKIIEMSPLEEEMATSPNEEILSAISEHAPTANALNRPDCLTVSPLQYQNSPRSKSTTSLAQRSKSQNRKDANSRIGVWVDGVVRWDYGALDELASQDADLLRGTGFTPVRPVTSGGELGTNKPLLSVVIPSNEPRINDQTLSTIVHRQPRRLVISVAPASIVSNLQVSPPSIVLDAAAITPDREPTTTPERPRTAGHPGCHRSHPSSSSISSRTLTDEESVYSRRSSATSVSLSSTPDKQHRLSLGKFSLLLPAQAGVFDEPPIANLNKSLPPTLTRTPPVSAPPLPPHLSKTVRLTVDTGNLRPVHPLRQSRSMSHLDQCDEEIIRTYVAKPHAGSPTLSQAEQDLRSQLSTMEELRAKHQAVEISENDINGIKRKDSVRDVMQPPAKAPTIPKRSRKRDWRKSMHPAMDVTQLPGPHALSRTRSEVQPKRTEHEKEELPLRKAASVLYRSKSPVNFIVSPKPAIDDSAKEKAQTTVSDVAVDSTTDAALFQPSPVLEVDEMVSPTSPAPAVSAEKVLLGILSCLTSTDDLSNTAMINKGMYRVYKENEMQLVRMVSFNQSPPAWELREWSHPDRGNEVASSNASSEASSQLEHTPLTYLRCYRRDLGVIEQLKRLILENCQTFIRRETAFALSTPSHPQAQRFNDAFWRIWGFCEIFGSKKGREDDFTGQLDWLKGGLLANNQGCVATVNTNLDFDMSSVLLNPPDYFGKANENGVSAAQLFDMTEIWTCLAVLLQSYSDRVDQARDYNLFDKCDVEAGDIEREEQMLEEWISYLLTLGPSVVLDMALLASDDTPAAFAYAEEQGWTDWSPPLYDGSRSNFLKEPVAKSYEDQVAAAKLRLRDPVEQEQKEMSRKRVASMAAEIRLRRQSSEYTRLPLIDMQNERPMSIVSRRSSVVSTYSSSTSPSRRSTRRASASLATPTVSPIALWKAPRPISPIIEDRVESFDRFAFQSYAGGIAEDTSEIAIRKIVSMGFPVTRAKEALRMTDMGEGLRVDRAVELLLRQQESY